MSEHKRDAMFSYFDERVAACALKREALLKDERVDEAVFEKIRSNVYDIFKAMLRVGAKAGGGEEEAEKRFFLEKLTEIPLSWEESYRKAEQHGDVEKVRIETIKLETVREIRAAFERIWEARL